MTKSIHRLLLACLASLALGADSATVDETNLLANERLWPYHVTLTRSWQPPGGEPLAAGSRGVLIRVEENGRARVDLGRDGLFEVPVAATDLVANAERIRRGELAKDTSNFLLEIGPRLADPSAETLRPYPLRDAARFDAFLCVFAEPSVPAFADLAARLGPLREHTGVLTVLFPQGDLPDARLREQLRALGWPVPFVLDHLSEPYTRSQLPEGASAPFVLLVSREGRVLAGGRFEPALVPALAAAAKKVERR